MEPLNIILIKSIYKCRKTKVKIALRLVREHVQRW